MFVTNYAETLKRVLREYHTRICELEDKKFDIEYIVKKKDFEVYIYENKSTTKLTLEKGKNNFSVIYIFCNQLLTVRFINIFFLLLGIS